jgi:hypothetical protein
MHYPFDALRPSSTRTFETERRQHVFREAHARLTVAIDPSTDQFHLAYQAFPRTGTGCLSR